MKTIDDIIEHLVGTSNAPPDWTAEEEEAVLEEIFRCSMCDSWQPVCEGDDGICVECLKEMRDA